MTSPGSFRWTIDTLDVTSDLTIDDQGREWAGGVNSEDKGWLGSPAPRTRREARTEGHGSSRGTAYRDPRVFTLGGYVACPDAATRERTELELAGLCSDPGRLYEFRRQTDSFALTAMVELDDEPLIEMVSFYSLRWSFQFAAPDPRKHDGHWQAPVSHPPTGGSGGLDYGTTGLAYAAGGLDYGATESTFTTAQVGNYGTAPAHPLFEITGAVVAPTVVDLGSGRTLSYTGTLVDGEKLWINCDTFPQAGIPGRSRLSTVRGDVSSLFPVRGSWPVVDPSSSARFQLRSSGATDASVRVWLRSAWW